jgi:hypothetical protein
MVARVAIKKGEHDTIDRGVHDLLNAWEPEGILQAVLVEISIIHTHPPFIIILL